MKTKALVVRNFKEMLRDPIIYIFCLIFPIALITLFVIINSYIENVMPIFQLKSLIPGILVFSLSFVMLVTSIIVSKDKMTSLLRRLFVAPLKKHNFILGYFIVGFIVEIIQETITILVGFIFALIIKEEYFSFTDSLLLIVSLIPMDIFFIAFGILAGLLFSDSAAPGMSSIIITASGVLGGAWMPLDTMGGFSNFCMCLPFYPAINLGRIITGAYHTDMTLYTFDMNGLISIFVVLGYTIISVILVFVFFNKKKIK